MTGLVLPNQPGFFMRSFIFTILFAALLSNAAVSGARDGEPLYEAAEEAFDGVLRGIAPAPLLERGPLKLMWAQWLGMPVVVLLGWLLAFGLTRLSRAVVLPLVNHTVTRWDDALLLRSAAADSGHAPERRRAALVNHCSKQVTSGVNSRAGDPRQVTTVVASDGARLTCAASGLTFVLTLHATRILQLFVSLTK